MKNILMKSQKVSVELQPDTVLQLAALFRGGLNGVGPLADAVNNIDRRALVSLADACNNINAKGLGALAQACNNINASGLASLADACNNINARSLAKVADACNNVDATRLSPALKSLNKSLPKIAGDLEKAAQKRQ